jgi:hypothetical protein
MNSDRIPAVVNLNIALLAEATEISAIHGCYAAVSFLKENCVSLEMAIALLGSPNIATELIGEGEIQRQVPLPEENG